MDVINETEKLIASYVGFKHCILTNSGTASLHSIYIAYDLRNKLVMTTPYTYYSTVNMLIEEKCVPVFVDINKDDYLLNPYLVKKEKKDLNISAIVAVNLFGKEVDYEKLKYDDIPLIVDSCQCFKPGIKGDAVAFSFQRSKNFNCGEGGCICTNDDEIARKCRIIMNQGEDGKYNTVMRGFNYRISDYQAIVVANQIKYHSVGGEAELGRWSPDNGHYPRVVYEQPLYKQLGIYKLWKKECPVAEDLAKKVREQ